MSAPPAAPKKRRAGLQRSEALELANARRTALRQLKAAIAGRELSARQVLETPPPCTSNMSVLEVAGWFPRMGAGSLALLNRDAVWDRINLAMPMRRASLRTRSWVADWLEAREANGR